MTERSRRVLVTGSAGLIGSEAVRWFSATGWEVVGVDNNMRADFFGSDGDTRWNLERLRAGHPGYRHFETDIRDRSAVASLIEGVRPDLLVHAAAQPSHDLAARRPFDDFDVNAVGTLNLLEACRASAPDVVFCFMSTNKVYGDAPNEIPLVELETRWDYADPEYRDGVGESMRIDASMHSLFGASKVAADVLVQEYGRYFGMRTACLRGGCLTGPSHSAAELHGFLAYVVRSCAEGRKYTVFGYKGKQVRDNIHAHDICALIQAIYDDPGCGEVFNVGGGRENSISVLEAIHRAEALLGRRMQYEVSDRARMGDHRCYITDLSRVRARFPQWSITRPLDGILEEMCEAARRV